MATPSAQLLRSRALKSCSLPSLAAASSASSLRAPLISHTLPFPPWKTAICMRASSSASPVRDESRPITVSSNSLYGGKQIIKVDEPLYQYILSHTREPQVLAELREETSSLRGSQMQVSPEQGQFLAMLVKLMGAERCIEVGVFTGYSSLAVALALPKHGRLVACERDKRSLDIARKYYERAGVSHKVDIYEGLALDRLKQFLDKGEGNSYDFTFLDADKRNYSDYYELLLQLIRPGGLVVIDNVLWHGKVANPQENDGATRHLRNLNSFIHQDSRVDTSMVPIGDGVTICRKR